MSIPVAIPDLPRAVSDQLSWCYLLTVAESGQARVLAVAPTWVDAHLQFGVGAGTAANVTKRPEVTLVWPPIDVGGMSLIVDGTATVDGPAVTFQPLTAVMHRSAVGG